mmetsp:Transcript_77560/g.154027  ORF Transcript_77560/g.154027 Transcript_77560/m.154027 type:complete len:96 (+) Transcript_77560:148-435(+)
MAMDSHKIYLHSWLKKQHTAHFKKPAGARTEHSIRMHALHGTPRMRTILDIPPAYGTPSIGHTVHLTLPSTPPDSPFPCWLAYCHWLRRLYLLPP